MVDAEEVIRIVTGKYVEIKKSYQQRLLKRLKESRKFYDKNVGEINAKLEKVPTCIEDIQAAKDFVSKQIPSILEQMEERFKYDDQILQIFQDNTLASGPEFIEQKWRQKVSVNAIMANIRAKQKLWEKCKSQFSDELSQAKEEFKQTVTNVTIIVDNIHKQGDISNHEEQYRNVQFMEQKLQDMKLEAKKYNMQESILGVQTTNYVILNNLNQSFTNYQNVWRIVNYWRNKETKWMNDDL